MKKATLTKLREQCYQDGTACIWDKSANYVRCVA